MKTITVSFELDESRAAALAQFVKRVGFHECNINAVDQDEARLMVQGLESVRRGLADAGYAPR